jgi:hypothetical protein
MPDETAPVVSGAPETPADSAPAPSSTDTQTSSTESTEATTSQPPADATPKEKADWKARYRDDPDFRAFVDAENQRSNAKARKRWERENTKLTAKDIVEKEDAEAALQFTKSVADSSDDDDDDEPGVPSKAIREKHNALVNDGFHETPEYRALWESDRAGLTKAFNSKTLPQFKAWVRDQGIETLVSKRVAEELKKQLPDRAKAEATQMTNEALKNVAVPLGGGGAPNGALTLERYNSDSALRAELRKTPEGRRKIDEMMARAAGG